MKKSKAQLFKEEIELLESKAGIYYLDKPDIPFAGVDMDGNLFLMEGEAIAPHEALRLAAWIIDTFEPREVDDGI
jgi:hypothetical protein